MIEILTTFAALSMAGSVVLSLLPEGGLKRTAGMAVGLISLMCWAEGIAALLGVDLSADRPATALAPTAINVQTAAEDAASALSDIWEATP